MRRAALVLTIVMFLLMSGTPAGASDVHTSGFDSVGSDRAIDFADQTKYDAALGHAVVEWREEGLIAIRPRSIRYELDLVFEDVNVPDGYVAQFRRRIGPDTIAFNSWWLDRPDWGLNREQNAAGHELGHALGLGDHYSDSYSTILMYFHNHEQVYVQPHDRHDYYSVHQ